MKWLVSGNANEKQPVPAIVPLFPPGTPGLRPVRQEL
jgi:hypothetical protein